MTAEKPEAARMRPVTENDSVAVGQILTRYIGDEPWKLDDLIPGGITFRGVEIAVDGSAALFDVFSGDGWDATSAPALGRVLIHAAKS